MQHGDNLCLHFLYGVSVLLGWQYNIFYYILLNVKMLTFFTNDAIIRV